MQASRDDGISHSLNDFGVSLQAVKAQLQRDEDRLQHLQRLTRQCQLAREKMDAEYREASEHCEALETECNRVVRLNDQSQSTFDSHRPELAAIRLPRKNLEDQVTEAAKLCSTTRDSFCTQSTNLCKNIMNSLRTEAPNVIRKQLTLRERDIDLAEQRITKFLGDLARLETKTATPEVVAVTSNDQVRNEDTSSFELSDTLASRRTANASFLTKLAQRRDVLRSQLRILGQQMIHLDCSSQQAQQAYCDTLDRASSHRCKKCSERLPTEEIPE